MLLENERFTEMLNYLKERYRYVFLDSPPLDLVSDGERIGNHCDGAILVIRAHETPMKAVKASIAQLERAGCPVLGYVLNRVSSSKGGYYTKRYGGYYGGYYGRYGDKYYYGYYGESDKNK
jgi:Mrp family chromosome partitioning ATPase